MHYQAKYTDDSGYTHKLWTRTDILQAWDDVCDLHDWYEQHGRTDCDAQVTEVQL